jgi:hypothetical protein
MQLRKLGSILLGDATSAQFILSALLGFVIGFIPSFSHAPLLMLWLFLVLILRVNIVYVVILTALSKLISFALIPATILGGHDFIRRLFTAAV